MADVSTAGEATNAQDANTVTLVVTREEAAYIAEGMQMLANANQFRFKDPKVDIRDLYGEIFAAVESVQAQVKRVLAEGA